MSDVHAAEADTGHVPAENDTEQRARRLGWVAKDEFRGDPDKHRSAEEFLERGQNIMPLLQRDNDKLHRRLSDVENLLKETREASKELLEFTSKSEQRAYERAKADILAKADQGASNADPMAVRAAMAELDALNKEQAKPEPKRETVQQPTVKLDPVIQDWIDKETWFNRDPVLNAYAVRIHAGLERDKPGVTQSELLAETKRRTMAKFPEEFGINPAREGAAAVASPNGHGAPRKAGKRYEDLPADAKRACDKFVRTIPGYTKEKYVADYDWEA